MGLETIYLTVFFFGFIGNMFLLYLHIHKFITMHRRRHISLIILNVAFAHIWMIFFRAIPIIANWGNRFLLEDTTGKILIYLMRMTRGLSLCSTCLLSVFQAITISPSSFHWAEIKTRAQKCILPCCILSWVFNLLLYIVVPMNISGVRNSSNGRWRVGCISFHLQAKSFIKFLVCESIVDALFVCLMICSSGYMVFVLHRHNQRVQHIHNANPSPRDSPETRATKAILMLVVTFVCLNSVSSPFVIYIAFGRGSIQLGLHLTLVLSMFYPTVSPFMLITIDTQMPKSFATFLALKSLRKDCVTGKTIWRKC